MRLETEQKIKLVTRIEALAALWRVKLQLGQYPMYISWTEAERPPVVERQQKRIRQ